jgi:hypothetical protein
MLGNRGKLALDESKWDLFEKKMKLAIYSLMHDLL